MALTPKLSMDEMTLSQSGKYITFNEAIKLLEVVCAGGVTSRTTSAQPGSPSDGDMYILPASPTGSDWASYSQNDLVVYRGTEWVRIAPFEGLGKLWVNDENSIVFYDGSSWIEIPSLYEEGTWTPVISDAASAGNNASFTTNEASYTRIGREITLYLDASAIDTTGMTGGNDVFILGLPYAAGAVGIGSVDENNVVFSGYLVAKVESGNSYFKVIDCTTGAADNPIIVTDITSTSGRLQVVLNYRV